MPQKNATYKVKGMQKDLSESAFNSEYAYDIRNMRLTVNGGETMLSLTNERGTKQIEIDWGSNSVKRSLEGIPVGNAVINHQLIVFTHVTAASLTGLVAKDRDRIYRLWFENDVLKGKLLKHGDFNFDTAHPFDIITSYESEDVQKIYWVDGLNQPRVINIMSSTVATDKIDFVTDFKRASLYVNKVSTGNGIFPSGTVQYFLTFYKKFGQETNIAAQSSVMYTTIADRAGAPDETCTCSFEVNISISKDSAFDYARLYSVHRTSESGVPTAYIVSDIHIPEATDGTQVSLSFIDHGTNQVAIDPTILLYVGGVEIVASTIDHKDGTLFLGDFTNSGSMFTDSEIADIKTYLRTLRDEDDVTLDPTSPDVQFSYTSLGKIPLGDVYAYNNQINLRDSYIRTFKGGERYRFGIQFVTDKGQWSNVFFMGDMVNYNYPKNVNGFIHIARITFDPSGLRTHLPSKVKGMRLLYAEMSSTNRSVLAQGVVCPTVFNLKQRMKNLPYAQSSWFMRPDNDGHFRTKHFENIQSLPYVVENDVKKLKGIDQDCEIEGYTLDTYTESALKTQSASTATHYYISVKVYRHRTALRGYVSNGYIAYSTSNSNPDNYTEVSHASSHKTVWKTLHVAMLSILSGNSFYNFPQHIQDMVNEQFSYAAFLNKFPDKNTYTSTPYTYTFTLNADSGYVNLSDVESNYFIDRSVLTLNSPDLSDMQDRIHNADVKFRLVGIVPITAGKADYSIHATNLTTLVPGGAKTEDYTFSDPNKSDDVSGLKTFPLWCDGMWTKQGTSGSVKWKCIGATSLYPIYPFQASGSLNGQPESDLDDNIKVISSELISKKIANLKFSLTTEYYKYDSSYLKKVWSPVNGISRPKICDSDHISYYDIDGNIYQGNYDYLLLHTKDYAKMVIDNRSYSTSKDQAEILMSSAEELQFKQNKPVRIKYKSPIHAAFSLNLNPKTVKVPNSNGDGGTHDETINEHVLLPSDDKYGYADKDRSDLYTLWDKANKYSIYEEDFYELMKSTDDGINMKYPYLWLGEFYVDIDSDSWLGGTSENAMENLKWIPSSEVIYPYLFSRAEYKVKITKCGEGEALRDELIMEVMDAKSIESEEAAELIDNLPLTISFDNNKKAAETFKNTITNPLVGATAELIEDVPAALINGIGDTYYQRWDCMKTAPYTEEDENSIIDVTSFMVETHINLDGRYDSFREGKELINMRPENTNKINRAYTGDASIFKYSILDSKFDSGINKNQITWSKTKQNLDDVDLWTNMTLASCLEFDGDKGRVVKIKRFGNSLVCFQEKGISEIQFNNLTALSTEGGVPIEIANSGKVNGKTYIPANVGCQDRSSICEGNNGLYFIDGYGRSIYKFTGQLDNLSNRCGFRKWSDDNLSYDEWNPEEFKGHITSFDSLRGDVYFTGKNHCLAYNEILDCFTSFYDYENTPYMMNLDNHFLSLHDESSNKLGVWDMHKGDYNMFYGSFKSFHVEYLMNPDMQYDKIFDTLDFRADTFDGNNLLQTTFDRLYVWNEYQKGMSVLYDDKSFPSSLKRKFRVWRANIPRSDLNNMDRIRNTWIHLKLAMENQNINRTILHDAVINYFI